MSDNKTIGHFTSGHVCEVCGISARKLNYWISQKVVSPSMYAQKRKDGRVTFLFDFETLLKIKFVTELRKSHLSLQRIKKIMESFHEKEKNLQNFEWKERIVVFDKNVFCKSESLNLMESLNSYEKGQLVFEILIIDRLEENTITQLENPQIRSIDIFKKFRNSDIVKLA